MRTWDATHDRFRLLSACQVLSMCRQFSMKAAFGVPEERAIEVIQEITGKPVPEAEMPTGRVLFEDYLEWLEI